VTGHVGSALPQKREGPVRELPVCEGANILDDNLLACSEAHIRKVFQMLEGQKNYIAERFSRVDLRRPELGRGTLSC
jgi:hypothetical protein